MREKHAGTGEQVWSRSLIMGTAGNAEHSALSETGDEASRSQGADEHAAHLKAALRVVALRVWTRTGAMRKNELLTGLWLTQQAGEFVIVVGQSGCGKSTLLKVLAGVVVPTSGSVTINGYDAAHFQTACPNSSAFLPQFGSFQEEMTVREILTLAAALRLPRRVGAESTAAWIEHVITLAGLEGVQDQRYKTLSGGQTRRVALAEALISDPEFLFLDELTSGLDEYSDREMMTLLRELAHQHGKTVFLVTHSTYHLDLCDSILMLHKGRLAFHGAYRELLEAHSNAESMGDVFGMYHDGIFPIEGDSADDLTADSADNTDGVDVDSGSQHLTQDQTQTAVRTVSPPGGLEQFPTLLWRQALLFVRDRGSLWLHLALVISFPVVVAVFATKGLPQVRQLALSVETNVVKTLHEQLLFMKESFQASALLSGLAMFQVVLLTLMGANNGAREIARERNILKKELRAGLSPVAYVGAKFLQVVLLCLVQAFAMAWFVKTMCGFPGAFTEQFGALFATVLAMGATCLAISAMSRSAERASLLSIYLVGFQLPLSGAALALPDWLNAVCRPFIAAYWGWSGYLQTLHDTRHYDIVKQCSKTTIAPYDLSIFVLLLHVVVSLGVAWWFVKKTGEPERL